MDVGQREAFLNDLLSWCLRFWGCQAPTVDALVDDFALIYQPAPLTSADAAALIDDYMLVATASLALSAPESEAMRAALLRLSRQTVARDSAEFSHSTCDAGGGAGGQAASAGAAGVSPGAGGSNP